MQNNMRDPAAGVPPQLLQHLHLVSKYRYPSVSMLSIETVVNYLLEAPKIVRDVQPMHWTFLDAPADGTVLLIWQPLDYIGTNFATDGYVWADAEHAFNHDAKGYTLEMYMHRSGFHPPNETVATHSRKRYRLTPGKVAIPGQPPCDPSLWLIHYTKAERRDHYQATSIPVQPQIQNLLRERTFLQRQGILTRKDFMLHDKANWPTINFPGPPSAAPGMPPQPGFGRGGPIAGTPNRGPTRPGGRASLSMAEPTLEEEEDVSRGDVIDFLTPREISRMRYEQHHEWMEEIMGSPYPINQIVPVQLGLGRKGALEELTNGFFTAPTSAIAESADGTPPRVGKMEGSKAEDFRKHADQKLAAMQAEIEQMKKDHAKNKAILQKSSIYTTAERRLRNAVEDPASVGGNNLRLEKSRPGQEVSSTGPKEKIADIIAEVESKTNKMAVPINDVHCVEKGGLEERVEEPTPQPAPTPSPAPATAAQEDVSMSTAPEAQSLSATQQPTAPSIPLQPDSEARSPLPSTAATHPTSQISASTTAPPPVPPPTDVQNTGIETEAGGLGDMDLDVDMGGIENQESSEPRVDDWVMVNEESTDGQAPASESTHNQPEVPAPTGNQESALAATASVNSPGFGNTPGSGIQGLTPSPPAAASSDSAAPASNQPAVSASSAPADPSPATTSVPAASTQASPPTADPISNTSNNPTPQFDIPLDDDTNFDSINTAGEAMESYGTDNDNITPGGLDLPTDVSAHDSGVDTSGGAAAAGEPSGVDLGDDLDLDDFQMHDDSAFGEAFHEPEPELGGDEGGDVL
ncbi:hypothetical protein UCRPC4_g01208 [Phaeomoniella chlamydospora]|uniref:DUF1750-domain-containing protein n=1 Tax=Phaeomoniella chlamydospora TaxID=158046 RepID=A0A0G2HFH3_PHACM|nr:hypothetical protein UCRPC4_g01208 [Phaeomoniella chlamydospora]